MSWLARLRNLARSDRHSRELDREFEFHIRERADDLIDGGMDPAAALVEARRRFGNRAAQKERARDIDLFPLLDSIRADVRYAIRSLLASPVFSVVAIASLALGIGANTAIFSLIDALVLRTLPVVNPHELVRVTLGTDQAVGTPVWEELRNRERVFTGVFAIGNLRTDLSTTGVLRPVRGSWVSGEFFPTLGVRPAAGRLLGPADDHRGCPAVAVLGHSFWKTEYGGDTAAIGKSLSLAGHSFRIVGVAEERFSGISVGQTQAVYAPLCAVEVLDPGTMEFRTWYVMGRMRPDLSPEQVRGALRAISRPIMESTLSPRFIGKEREERLAREFGLEPAGTGVSYLRMAYGKALYVLAAIAGVVLLVACANVANLLLARGTSRRREIAVRLALGASRARLARQLVIESLVLALTGAVLGILMARGGGRILISILSQSSPVYLDLAPGWRVLGFACAVGGITALLFGVGPAFRETAVDPNDALKSGSRGLAATYQRLILGKVLVASQVALALVVITVAGLLLGSFRRLATEDPGFRSDRVLLVSADLGDARLPGDQQSAIQARFLAALQALPSVDAATTMRTSPIDGVYMTQKVTTRDASGTTTEHEPHLNHVGPAYFQTLGIRLIAGREFVAGDRDGAPLVAVVNRAAAAKLFGSRDPVAQTFRVRKNAKELSAPITVVGVVENAKYWSLREKPPAIVYRPFAQTLNSSPTYALRTTAEPSSLVAAVTSAGAAVEPRIRLSIRTLSQQVAGSLTREQLLALLSTFFGGLALLLATIGVYGIMAYGVSRRRNEFGIRIAVGATPRQVIGLVTRDMMVMMGSGLLIGSAIALASTRMIRSFLYGVSPTDPWALGGSVLVLILVACMASTVPALRASRVDPVFALRDE
jgi:predicted permease